jgi:hypothetical protein
MGKSSIERDYHCHNDCRQSGCPGHRTRLTYENSGTVSVEIDGKHSAVFDHSHWRALVNMDQELRDRG